MYRNYPIAGFTFPSDIFLFHKLNNPIVFNRNAVLNKIYLIFYFVIADQPFYSCAWKIITIKAINKSFVACTIFYNTVFSSFCFVDALVKQPMQGFLFLRCAEQTIQFTHKVRKKQVLFFRAFASETIFKNQFPL